MNQFNLSYPIESLPMYYNNYPLPSMPAANYIALDVMDKENIESYNDYNGNLVKDKIYLSELLNLAKQNYYVQIIYLKNYDPSKPLAISINNCNRNNKDDFISIASDRDFLKDKYIVDPQYISQGEYGYYVDAAKLVDGRFAKMAHLYDEGKMNFVDYYNTVNSHLSVPKIINDSKIDYDSLFLKSYQELNDIITSNYDIYNKIDYKAEHESNIGNYSDYDHMPYDPPAHNSNLIESLLNYLFN